MLEISLSQKPISRFDEKDAVVFYNKQNPLAFEPLVDITEYNISGENYYARKDGFNYPYFKKISDFDGLLCRKTVAEKLQQVNEDIGRFNLELFVLDAFRPIKTQGVLWDYFFNQAKINGKNNQEAEIFAKKYCSSLENYHKDNPLTHPVHSTGGAVDVTLSIKSNKGKLFMGSIFDEADKISSPDWFEFEVKKRKLTESEKAAMLFRRILHNAMIEKGFVPHPNEWWHFDYGTKLWAKSGFNQNNSGEFFYCEASL